MTSASVVEVQVEHLRWGLVEEMLRQLIRHLAVATSTFTIPMLGMTRRYLTGPAASKAVTTASRTWDRGTTRTADSKTSSATQCLRTQPVTLACRRALTRVTSSTMVLSRARPRPARSRTGPMIRSQAVRLSLMSLPRMPRQWATSSVAPFPLLRPRRLLSLGSNRQRFPSRWPAAGWAASAISTGRFRGASRLQVGQATRSPPPGSPVTRSRPREPHE